MKTERMPWTCRWSEFRPVEPAPLWLDEWLSQWACLAGRRSTPVGGVDRCAACASWEPRAHHVGAADAFVELTERRQ